MSEPFEHWLKRSRKSLDLTQLELARRVGCAESTLRKIESGRLRPSRQIAERLAMCLEIPAAERLAFVDAARRNAILASSTHAIFDDRPSLQTTIPTDQPEVLSFPTPLVPLIGRAQDVSTTIDLLQRSDTRLLTLIGPPGVGKTRLAIQIAADLQNNFSDGVYFISLASVHTYDLLLTTIAQALGVREQSGRSLTISVASFLREKQLLLVLDNMEQLASACTPLLNLLRAAPRLKLLCTSRIVLHLAGEYSYTVRPLDLLDSESAPTLAEIAESPAVALLISRIAAHTPNVVLTPATAALAMTLCRRLDGLPLAIELAAAQLRLLSIADLLNQFERLGSAGPLRLLRSGPQHWAGQETLWDVIATSYALLSEPARQLFTALAIFASSCTLDAALAVGAIPGSNETARLGALAELVDASLLQRVSEPAHETRLVMLETIRTFALAQQPTNQPDTARAFRYVAYYRALAGRIETAVLGMEQRRWLEYIVAEQPNIRVALSTSLESDDPMLYQDALHICVALWWAWWACGYGAEARSWIEQTLNVAPGETAAYARGWYAAGALAIFAGDVVSGTPHLERSLALSHTNGGRSSEAHALIFIAMITALGGDPPEGVRLIEQSITLFRAGGAADYWGLGLALMSRRMFVIYQGDYHIARLAGDEALTVFSALGQPYGMALAHNSLGDIARLQQDDAAAVDHYRRAITLLRESGVVSDLSSMLHNRAYAELSCGELSAAASCLHEALLLSRRADLPLGVAECLTGCAGLAILAGNPIQAAELFGAVDALYAPEPGPRWPPERQEYERYRTAAHDLIGSSAFIQAWEVGSTRPISTTVGQVADLLVAFHE